MPQLLEAGDVVDVPVPAGGFVNSRLCKIIEIHEADAEFKRSSVIEWMDTGERESKRWKAARGINQPVWVVDGPKVKSVIRREAKVKQSPYSGRLIWEGYIEETVGV